MSNSEFALCLIKNGTLLITSGLVWGLFIHRTPYPRIALSTHLTLLQHGLLNVAAAVILKFYLIELNPYLSWAVIIPHFALWGVHACGFANAWWGSDRTWKIVLPLVKHVNPQMADEAGAPGTAPWKATIVALAPYFVVWLIPAWGIILYHLFFY